MNLFKQVNQPARGFQNPDMYAANDGVSPNAQDRPENQKGGLALDVGASMRLPKGIPGPYYTKDIQGKTYVYWRQNGKDQVGVLRRDGSVQRIRRASAPAQFLKIGAEVIRKAYAEFQRQRGSGGKAYEDSARSIEFATPLDEHPPSSKATPNF